MNTMLLILVALVLVLVCALALFRYAADGYHARHVISGLFGVVLCGFTGLALVNYAFMGWSWLAAESKAQIINREYGTNYTRKEVFFASDVIDTIREIDRKRIEVNGDLMREEEDE